MSMFILIQMKDKNNKDFSKVSNQKIKVQRLFYCSKTLSRTEGTWYAVKKTLLNIILYQNVFIIQIQRNTQIFYLIFFSMPFSI